jgi:hypothetical protein
LDCNVVTIIFVVSVFGKLLPKPRFKKLAPEIHDSLFIEVGEKEAECPFKGNKKVNVVNFYRSSYFPYEQGDLMREKIAANVAQLIICQNKRICNLNCGKKLPKNLCRLLL